MTSSTIFGACTTRICRELPRPALTRRSHGARDTFFGRTVFNLKFKFRVAGIGKLAIGGLLMHANAGSY